MAEVKTTQEKTENKRENVLRNKQTCNNPTFNTFDIFCVLFSLGTFVADLSTDIILIVEYSRCGHTAWAVSTLLLMLLPASVIQLFSLRWHKLDEQISTLHYIFHAFLLGIAQRYYLVLRTGLDARASGDITDFQRLYQQQSDLCMLHLFDSFMESAPQLILQLYVMITMGDWHSWTGLSASASLCSLAWAIAAYTRAMRRVRPDKNRVRWPGLVLQATWRGGMLAARISAMVLFALAFNYWLLAVMGIHWIAMTTWVVLQDTDFCPTVWEERIYNGIVGVIYCFSFFNICEGRSRRRVFAFYLVVVTQNVTCLILVISLNLIASIEIIIISTVLILGGTVVGLCSMTLYYTKFHPAGPIPCCPLFGDIETSSPPSSKEASESGSKVNTLRSLKHIWTQDRACPLGQTEGVSLKSSPRSDDGCTDKKLLLENWIARSGSPMFASAPISQDPDNSLDDIEFHTVVNSADTSYDKGVVNEGYKCSETFFSETERTNSERHKRRGICSPTELGLKLAQLSEQCTNITPENSTLTSQKRRGICSSDQLVLDLSDLNNIDTLTNPDVDVNLNDDVKLKRRPIYSVGSTLNSFNVDLNLKNMYSVRLMKMCSDDKSVCSSGTLKPEEYMEMSSEVLSAHDYENICAVNIARERWGLRSWEGYTDIETFLHDDSTVRDRRRDTLTSTVTGTSASSEISSSDTASSPPPLIPNRRPRPLRSRQDDYLDTLIYDLVDCDKRRVHILDGNDEHEVESNVFIAKPYVVDQHGMFFPLGSTLEPIEELEEPILTPDKVDHIMRKPRSSLVATIDEIRRGTDTDSPRNVYHRTEHVWDDDVQQIVKNIPDAKRVSPVSKNVVKSLWNDNSNSLTIDIKIVEQINSPPKLPAKVNNKLTNDASNQETIEKLNIDIFKTSPLDAQKQKDERTNNTLLQGNGHADENRKTSKIGNKPRRKFSLLREKFEPKCKENEEILTSSSMEMGSTVNLIDDLKSAKFTTPVITKVVQWNNVIRSQDKNTGGLCEGQLSISDQESSVTTIPDRSPLSSLQDKRNVFLKQVLSPPKFNCRSKRQSLSSKDFNSK